METSWSNALWRQFGAAIDMLDNALAACPDSLWRQRLWGASLDQSQDQSQEGEFAVFWYLTYHTLFWLNLYLSGLSEEKFTPELHFRWVEIGRVWRLPEQPYTKEDLRTYLAATRQKCQATLTGLTDEQARQIMEYPWSKGQTISFLELQMYSLRHVQEHVAQLSLLLGQHGVPDEQLDWVPFAKG